MGCVGWFLSNKDHPNFHYVFKLLMGKTHTRIAYSSRSWKSGWTLQIYHDLPSNIGVQLADDPQELSWRGTFGKHTKSIKKLLNMAIYSWFTHQKWWCFIVILLYILVYQRVTVGDFWRFFPEKCEWDNLRIDLQMWGFLLIKQESWPRYSTVRYRD